MASESNEKVQGLRSHGERIFKEQTNLLLSKKTISLQVEVNTPEEAERLLIWMYREEPAASMLPKLLSLGWDSELVPKAEAELLNRIREVMTPIGY